MALCRESLVGEKGRGPDGEYTLELAPQQRQVRSVGVFRERPLPRRRVLARPEAAIVRERRSRGGTANANSPSVPHRDRGF
ncbi:hypothetical protein MM59RIKEN_31600 (plasmid) [Pusillibacter faecalis]|jgi:hypothetical protein|uniref:Uncharacterized protein n=1 Tax=Pusillibacter faecalis TaxID=2714358 RepID=A0A830QSH8_9FIRM|nr:hypothetical protein MM59RIKEN_31600 [Pusillibacter faecalis]